MVTPERILKHNEYLEQHEEYITLMEEHYHTELYKEIVDFMYLAFPEWTSNKGVGSNAAELVLSAINDCSYLYNRETNYSSFKILHLVYLELVSSYKYAKTLFDISFIDKSFVKFDYEYEGKLAENEHLPEEEYDALYDQLFDAYKKQYLNKVTYEFRYNDDIPQN